MLGAGSTGWTRPRRSRLARRRPASGGWPRAFLPPTLICGASLARVRARHGPAAYPGSPLIAAEMLRPGDVLHLAELHPQAHAALQASMAPYGARVLHRDEIEAALAICPPTPRRGIMLVDPSWEVKEEYAAIPKAIARIRVRWNVGIVALWYPILADAPHAPMLDALSDLDPDALRHEVSFGPAREGHRMIGLGLFVTNPPYGLASEAERIGTIFDALPAPR